MITGIFAYYIVTSPDIGTGMLIPFTGKYLQLPVWLFVPALFFIILGTVVLFSNIFMPTIQKKLEEKKAAKQAA